MLGQLTILTNSKSNAAGKYFIITTYINYFSLKHNLESQTAEIGV